MREPPESEGVHLPPCRGVRRAVQTIAPALALDEVRALLKELAVELKREAAASPRSTYNVAKCQHLTSPAKQIISYLSPMEERTMLSAFGLIDQRVTPSAVASVRVERK